MKKSALSALFLLLALAACANVPDEDQDQSPQTQADISPPTAPDETIPQIQDPQHQIWKPGHWALGSAGFYWVSGEVITRPDPTAVWATARWVHHTYGWSFEKGHWE
jgi:hypothetical protein